jgi:hypothetical protein
VARTGDASGEDQQRYLWTDAFAVCNLLGLARASGDGRYRTQALTLVERVHHTLGRHRPDAARRGWLDGAAEEHPTRGGLRIGKPLPERPTNESLDSQLEWDRDGQYFHYLTKWMHALDQTARATGQPAFNLWARELAKTAHAAFTHAPSAAGPKRMYWKLSIDLSRPLVPSMGQHDPLDGYVTAAQLQRTAAALEQAQGPRLEGAIADYASMIADGALATDDPLGIGGLLSDAYRIEQLMRGGLQDNGLLAALLRSARAGLSSYRRQHDPSAPAERRLAFRELGLAIGLDAAGRMLEAVREACFAGDEAARKELEALRPFLPMGDDVVAFWLRDSNRRARTWTGHHDINQVMLATSLAPEGFLVLRAPEGHD